MRNTSRAPQPRRARITVLSMIVAMVSGIGASTPAVTLAQIGASADTSKPSMTTVHPVTGGGGGGGGFPVTINEAVILDPNHGPWLKELVNNTGSGISSGSNRAIDETLTNTGPATWSGWHEHVVSRTELGGPPPPNDDPGFLFHAGSLHVSADYGSGNVPLVEGVDYTLVAPPYAGPGAGGGNAPHWESIDILLAAHRYIETGDTLRVEKDIFEVFLDANTWQQGEAAVIAQYPIAVPEPGAIGVVAVAGAAMTRRPRGARGRRE